MSPAAHTIASPHGPTMAAERTRALPAKPTATPPSPERRSVRAIAAGAAAAIALAGCGGSSHTNGTTIDPASAVPATVALYAGADVRPSGAEKSGALAAGSALTHRANPYQRLVSALQTPGSPRLRYAQDVAPWLGAHAGIFLTSLGSSGSLGGLLQQGVLGSGSATQSLFPFATGGAQGALVLDTSDASKARSFLDGQAKRAGAHAASYHGVSFLLSSGGVAFALVHRLAVIGTEAGLRGVIDTTAGGPSLAASGGYAKLRRAAPAGALARVYSNPAASSAHASAEGLAGLLGLLAGTRQSNVSLIAKAGSLALDADTLASASNPGGLISADPESATALAELPAESWLAVGLGHVGTGLARDVGGLRALASLAGSGSSGAQGTSLLNPKSLLEGLLAPLDVLGGTSAQARRDFASWMGSAGIFASGGSLLELKAAIVISSKDPARSRAAVGKLAAQLQRRGGSLRAARIAGTDAAVGVALPGLPVVLDIADGRDANGQTKFVLGLAEASVTDALQPPATLAASAPHRAAAAALGEGIKPSLMLDFPTLLSLLEGVALTEDPSISPFVPYLRAATTLAGGARAGAGEVERFRLVLGLQSSGG
jgi:Protein of unknown function (DUF3352)